MMKKLFACFSLGVFTTLVFNSCCLFVERHEIMCGYQIKDTYISNISLPKGKSRIYGNIQNQINFPVSFRANVITDKGDTILVNENGAFDAVLNSGSYNISFGNNKRRSQSVFNLPSQYDIHIEICIEQTVSF